MKLSNSRRMATYAERRIHEAVVDTGALVSALALYYVRVADVREPKKTQILSTLHPYLRDTLRQESYMKWFGGIHKLFTTSHVIGELQGRSHKLRLGDEDRKYFWLHSTRFLREHNLSEELLQLLDMCSQLRVQETVFRVGPTDAGLIELARGKKNRVLLTEDGELASLARQNQVRYQLVRDLPSS